MFNITVYQSASQKEKARGDNRDRKNRLKNRGRLDAEVIERGQDDRTPEPINTQVTYTSQPLSDQRNP